MHQLKIRNFNFQSSIFIKHIFDFFLIIRHTGEMKGVIVAVKLKISLASLNFNLKKKSNFNFL
jgi:hypothetical protein